MTDRQESVVNKLVTLGICAAAALPLTIATPTALAEDTATPADVVT